MKKIVCLALLLSTLLCVTVFAQELTIMTESWPPFNFEEDGEVVGISADIVNEILERLDIEAEIKILPWARAYDTIQNKDNHVLFSTGYSEERAPLFKWVGPLAEFKIALYAKKGSGVEINSLEDAKKVKLVGVPRESLTHNILTRMEFPNLDISENADSMLRKLFTQRTQLICSASIAMENMSSGLGFSQDDFVEAFVIRKSDLYIAFSKNVPDSVINEWQEVLDEFIADGTVAEIKSRY